MCGVRPCRGSDPCRHGSCYGVTRLTAAGAMTNNNSSLTLKVLTVNTHKGFTVFNRRFILHELRDAIRQTHADIVFLQEVLGAHHRHASALAHWPTTTQ